MRKVLIPLLVISIIVIFVFSSSNYIFAVPEIERSIRIGADNHLPPYSYVNDNGIFKGFYIDIMRAIAIEIGIDVELHPMPWYQLKNDLNNNRIDAIIGMNVSTQDTAVVVSDPFLTSSETIFVRIDNKYIVNIEDLKNVRVAIHRGNIPQNLLKQLDPNRIEYVENQQQGIQKMMMGKVDAFIGDRLSGLYTIQKWKQENFIKIVGDPINKRSYGIAVRKEDKELIKLFNKGLQAIKANGTYDKIYKKWFGETLNPNIRLMKKIITVTGLILFCVGIVILVILRWNTALKKEVKKRTVQLDKANKQLLEQKKQLENEDKFKEEILNSVLSGIITINKDKRITFINSSGSDVFGTSKDKMLGEKIDKTILCNFFDSEKLDKVLKKGNYYKNQEIEINHNNVKKILNYNLYPLIEKNMDITGAIISFKDITQEKQMQAELARKDKIQALGLMVSGIAHEIRNPLTTIKTFIDLIPYKIDNKNFRNKFMELVPNEINRLNNIITELLEYSSPKKPDKQIIQTKAMFQHIYILFSKQFRDKEIDFALEVNDDSRIYADKNQIKQVFINIILNSLEAVSKGGKIRVSSETTNGVTGIIIEDNGCGISKENLDKVMDPFFTTKSKGTGLGLFICYQILKENNGNIDIESRLGEGTKVTVKLPSKADNRGDQIE